MEAATAKTEFPALDAGGRVENESPAKERQNRLPPNFLRPLLGKKVLARMSDGRPIHATLSAYNSYEIVFDLGNGKRLLTFKHAVASIEFEGPHSTDKNPKKTGGRR